MKPTKIRRNGQKCQFLMQFVLANSQVIVALSSMLKIYGIYSLVKYYKIFYNNKRKLKLNTLMKKIKDLGPFLIEILHPRDS